MHWKYIIMSCNTHHGDARSTHDCTRAITVKAPQTSTRLPASRHIRDPFSPSLPPSDAQAGRARKPCVILATLHKARNQPRWHSHAKRNGWKRSSHLWRSLCQPPILQAYSAVLSASTTLLKMCWSWLVQFRTGRPRKHTKCTFNGMHSKRFLRIHAATSDSMPTKCIFCLFCQCSWCKRIAHQRILRPL